MKKLFKKVPLEDVYMVYELYCKEENIELEQNKIERAKEIYSEILFNKSYTYACYIDDRIVASVNVYKNMQYYPTDLEAPFIHLECVMVLKEYQNQGIGTELITNVINLVTKEGCTYIIGQSPNPAMQKVFYKAGLTDQSCKDFRKEVFN
jgi:Acetyltransferase (GNAT) family.